MYAPGAVQEVVVVGSDVSVSSAKGRASASVSSGGGRSVVKAASGALLVLMPIATPRAGPSTLLQLPLGATWPPGAPMQAVSQVC